MIVCRRGVDGRGELTDKAGARIAPSLPARTGTWDPILEQAIVKEDYLGTLEDNVAFVVSVDPRPSGHPRRTDGQAPPGRRRRGPPLLDEIRDLDVNGQRMRVGRVLADKAYTQVRVADHRLSTPAR